MENLKQFARALVFGVVLIPASLLVLSPAEAKTQKPGKQLGGLYNTRYCEIFTVTAPEPPNFFVDIFNTVGLNRCPAKRWNAVDFDQVKQSQNALLAVPNGPRRWVIDAISGATAGKPFVLGGLRMRHVATLETPTLQPAPFTVLTVNRTTTWNYRKGRYLRQVISPKGKRYAMQAYTRTINPHLKQSNLNRIDRRPAMALPEGWRFKVKKLKRKVTLTSVGSTRIVRDGLGSVYQRFRWKTDK